MRRQRSLIVMYLVVAIVLAVFAVAGVNMLFAARQPSLPPLNELAFTAPVPAEGRGLAISARVLTNGCDPWVDVAVVAQGPREYWHAISSRLGSATPMAITVLGSEVRNLDLDVAEVGNPLVGSGVQQSSEPVYRDGELRKLRAEYLEPSRPDIGATDGVVVSSWSQNRAPLLATFEAKWVEQTGFKRCVLHLPPLVGADLDDAYAAGDGYLSTKVPGYKRQLGRGGFEFASFGRATVVGADVDRATSSPPPALDASDVFYSCSDNQSASPRGESPKDASTRMLAKAQTRSLATIRGEAAPRRCAAFVELRDSNHDGAFNLWLLLVGALLSLATTALLSAMVEILRRPTPPVPASSVEGPPPRASLSTVVVAFALLASRRRRP